ncbi:glutamine synthetase family protein [Halorubrum vacuolatum]|uniref:glutamine synthetase family protein n=1 Tax=Halorubrum vacuolatum TaxID=63740 RepID=UPI001C5321CD|nr:glutamine synthetase family protein [Halorubrum vacuolatum]
MGERTDTAVDRMRDRIAADGIDHVFLEFPDINGISRSKQVSPEYFLEHWEDGFTVNLLILAQTPRNDVPEGSGLGEEIGYGDGMLQPVPGTVRPLPWRDDAVRVLCDVTTAAGDPLTAAPRTALQRMIDRIEGRDDAIAFTVGSELEFYLLDAVDGRYEPATSHKHEFMSWATEELSAYTNDLAAWSDTYGVPVHSIMHEHGAGQLEALFEYGDPLTQADRTFDFKRLVKQTAREHDRWATFMAKPFGDRAGSGYHLHVGGRSAGHNVFADGDGLSAFGRRFVGGILEHADALAALGTPTLNAFKRYKPNSFAPSTASWGFDDRTVGVRIPSGTTRVENRIPSADANPYLVIASTLAAGIHGVEAGIEPPEPVDSDPDGERPSLPISPERSLRALANDDVIRSWLGEDVIRVYTASKRAELQAFRDVVTDWERTQYVQNL